MKLTQIYSLQRAGDLGRQAFYSGYRRHDNPFPLNTPEAKQWAFSWATAEKEEAFQLQHQAASLAFYFNHSAYPKTKAWETTVHNNKIEMFHIKVDNCRVYFVVTTSPDQSSRLDITAIKHECF